VLIGIRYFERFGGNQKLYSVFDQYFNGKQKITKTVKSFAQRMEACRAYEASVDDKQIPICEQLALENENVGLCLSIDKQASGDLYFVQELDAQYGIKCVLYSVQRGTSGQVRVRKNTYESNHFEANQCIRIEEGKREPRYAYKERKRTPIEGESDYWVKSYKIVQ